MIDLHCHILPGIDDGAPELPVSLAMARAFVEDGVQIVACTPHILPGVYPNTGPKIDAARQALQRVLRDVAIPLRVVVGADIHIVPNMVARLKTGELPTLAGSRYVLVEPPHHVAPPRIEDLFFSLTVAGYVPILTHPERLSWIESDYGLIASLPDKGVWIQVTAGSLLGAFGQRARYWAERLLDERRVHILATDAHDMKIRPPCLGRARDAAAKRLGQQEAEHLVVTRPRGVIDDVSPAYLPLPGSVVAAEVGYGEGRTASIDAQPMAVQAARSGSGGGLRGWFARGLRGGTAR